MQLQSDYLVSDVALLEDVQNRFIRIAFAKFYLRKTSSLRHAKFYSCVNKLHIGHSFGLHCR